jgi:solute carrier family 35 protein F5
MFCAVWFAANVTINAALAQTSVSSVTILSSLSGLFTLVLGSFFAIEKPTMIRFLAVVAR